ncbi:type III restriction protein res subunit [Arcobacter nitrofigilis DSM 7299]|uniref:Type III restriction protein res subunit n=1 Tax=Arcobacter nitrofigilis (strain ATCC 33309 / DSM 7299 / CCUG 15893 / LMG 7604 / NCTC 12251 / CI) TaxID=572480 RepID=D5V5J5_ARCNC|nr:DEAD/DEAH box helicase [Arcobacter nitrofigilis]ADG92031.1 type III restriction protein res subunit [Arcobacter nitrofigilis DSM 7299]
MNSLITNGSNSNFYTHLTKLLRECKSYYFSVAFINFSGLQLLLDSLEFCQKNAIKGKILTSTYLNFTQPKALKKLLEYENIDLKIYDTNHFQKGFHTKAYIFEFEDDYKILLGSSNITASAFKSNVEWNIKTVSKKDDIFTNEILSEFDTLFKQSFEVNTSFINEYENFYNKNKIEEFSYKRSFTLNSMQEEALYNLQHLRDKRQTKALVLAATGTGKTYLAAFDVKAYEPKRVLFIVHRENILIKAKNSFEKIISNKTMGLYTGNKKEIDKEYLFTTIQTMSSNYENFLKEEFDYIIIDEAHHITSPSYEKVCDYFEPKFLLGLTATPNRSDEGNIYEVFDENIACDIRLNNALEHNLISSFHYYGISDIESIDYENIDILNISQLSKALMVNKRVDYIIEKMDFYSFDGKKRKALAFCASKEHANFMAEEFSKKGIMSIALTSGDSIEKREEYIKNLEDDNNDLEVICSVDIFNEGIDIPSINSVLFLRPTNSSIVFVQQLGRGLRKHKNKEFVTILDFIGNHNRAYMVAFGLLGDKIIDKESLKIALSNDFANIAHAFISMDEISKKRVLEQIEKENFYSMRYLKQKYYEFKSLLSNKIPMLEDYIAFSDHISPLDFISESKSYIEFLQKVEDKDEFKILCQDENFLKAIRFCEFLLPIKRVYEFVILKYLLTYKSCSEKQIFDLLNKELDFVCKDTIKHSFRYLNQEFFDKLQVQRYLKLVDLKENKLFITKEFEKILEKDTAKTFMEHSLNYGIITYKQTFKEKNYGLPFLKLYEKYNMLNIALVCNLDKIHTSFRGSGFLKHKDDFFLFITLQKDKMSKSSKYKNNFLSKKLITYVSKPNMSSDKSDGLRLSQNIKYKTRLHLFVRKISHEDKKVQAFIYLGLCNSKSYEGNKPINITLELEREVRDELYEEFTKLP